MRISPNLFTGFLVYQFIDFKIVYNFSRVNNQKRNVNLADKIFKRLHPEKNLFQPLIVLLMKYRLNDEEK